MKTTDAKCEAPAKVPRISEIRRDLPIMLYDGDCGFCMSWINCWQKVTGNKIQYVPYQFFAIGEESKLTDFPLVSVNDCKRAVQLVMPDGSRFQAAEAVFRALHFAGTRKYLLWLYKYFLGFKQIAELLYKLIAGHRRWLSRFRHI